MESDRLTPPLVAPIWVTLAGLAAQATFSLAPGSGREFGPYAVAVFLAGLAVLTAGLVQRAFMFLLVGVPLIWGLAALRWPPNAYDLRIGAVALASAVVYLGLALLWCRRTPDGAVPARVVATEARAVGVGVTPYVVLLVVVVPALALLSPAARSAAVRGFPSAPGRALVAAGVVAFLVSIALLTDLARGRPPLRGRMHRVVTLGALSAVLLTLWFVVRQGA